MRKIVLTLMIPLFMYAQNFWVEVGKEYNIEPKLLYAIAKVESDVRANLISVNYSKLSPSQKEKLYGYLEKNQIKHETYTKVVSINNKDIKEAIMTIDFLYENGYQNFDIGMMQINAVHQKTLASAGITLYDLMNPYLNIRVGAFILSGCFHRHKNTQNAVNAYNGKINGNPYFSKIVSTIRTLEKKGDHAFFVM